MNGIRKAFAAPLRASAGLVALALAASGWSQVQVQVNGRRLVFNGQGAAMVGGRILVPLRGIMESLGAQVEFDGASQSVTATRGGSKLALTLGRREASVDGRLVTLDVPAQVINGSTMVPLRFVGEALGADVKWEGSTQTVMITADGTVSGSTQGGSNSGGTTGGSNGGNGGGTTTNPAPGAPTITQFALSAPQGGWLRGGETLTATLSGTAGGSASFYIPGVVDNVAMREVRPGVYEGSYAVPRNVSALRNASAIGRLSVGGKEQLIQASTGAAFDSAAPTITAFAPGSGDRLVDRRPTITAAFSDDASGIDRASVRLLLDGRDVSESATRGEGLLSYSPREDLAPGEHRARIVVADRAGNQREREWTFLVADAANIVKSFTVESPDRPAPGDTIRFRLEGEPGARSVISAIGEKVVDLALRETQPGVYTGEYTVKRSDNFGRERVTARFESKSGERFNVESKNTVGNAVLAAAKPTITSPVEGKLKDDNLTVTGTAPNAKRVEVTIEYETSLLGILGSTGTIATKTVDVDKDGRFTTDAINVRLRIGGSNTSYTVTVVGISEDGTRSEAATVRVTR